MKLWCINNYLNLGEIKVMKSNICFMIVAALMFFTVNASAVTFSGEVGVNSQNMYRGEVLSDNPSVYGNMRVDNILLDGLFVEGSASSIYASPINDSSVRSELNIGWHGSWDKLSYELSVARTFNTRVDFNDSNDFYLYNSFDYNEARVKVDYQLTDTFNVYGMVAQGFENPSFNSADYRSVVSGANTYAAIGVETDLNDMFTVGALVSGQHYDNVDDTRYHNAEVYALANVWNDFFVEGRFSFGGENVAGKDAGNEGYLGISYRF